MGEEDPDGVYETSGRMHRQMLDDILPEDWYWEGKRVLDFGCGVGRVLRQFLPEAGEAEFYGCDLDTPSVEWLQQNFSPPFQIFESSEKAGPPAGGRVLRPDLRLQRLHPLHRQLGRMAARAPSRPRRRRHPLRDLPRRGDARAADRREVGRRPDRDEPAAARVPLGQGRADRLQLAVVDPRPLGPGRSRSSRSCPGPSPTSQATGWSWRGRSRSTSRSRT